MHIKLFEFMYNLYIIRSKTPILLKAQWFKLKIEEDFSFKIDVI